MDQFYASGTWRKRHCWMAEGTGTTKLSDQLVLLANETMDKWPKQYPMSEKQQPISQSNSFMHVMNSFIEYWFHSSFWNEYIMQIQTEIWSRRHDEFDIFLDLHSVQLSDRIFRFCPGRADRWHQWHQWIINGTGNQWEISWLVIDYCWWSMSNR